MSDLDGTLLNRRHILADETREAVLALRKAGISFMPASGRDYQGVQGAISSLHIHPKCICLNGAEFYDNAGNLVISNPIPNEVVRNVQQVIDALGCDCDYFGEDGRYIHITETITDLEAFLARRFQFLFRGEHMEDAHAFIQEHELTKSLHTEQDIEVILAKVILKVELIFETDEAKALAIKKLAQIEGIITTSSHELNLEINSIEATKGHMVEQVCANYGYHKDEVVVIGDGVNDIPMLKLFPNSYAMGQANEQVKAAANFVADSNKNHGVAKLIYQILENNKK